MRTRHRFLWRLFSEREFKIAQRAFLVSGLLLTGSALTLAQERRESRSNLQETQDDNGEVSIEENLEPYLEAAAGPGDPKKGEAVFNSDQATCAKCHVVGGTTRSAGPDLLGIADKYPKEKLIEAVLEPNATLLPDYATNLVSTADGTVYAGIVRKLGADEVQLIDEQGKLVSIPVEDIEERVQSAHSLMPEGLQKNMSPEQFGNLIAYLESLKQPLIDADNSDTVALNIAVIANQVRLIPFHGEEVGFSMPVWMVPLPGSDNKFLVLEQRNRKVWMLEKADDGDKRSLFLDLSDEISDGQFEGLVCLAFHPDFLDNRKYYLNHTIREGPRLWTVVVERVASDDYQKDSGQPTRRLLEIRQETEVHNGGMLGFGPDGYLYISTGDGGPQKDPDGRGQSLNVLSGSMIRIDVDGRDEGLEYSIPKSNPYFDSNTGVRREIWAHGFRNVWRFSWDPLTKDFWIGDVGQNLYEEITIARVGENHGWNVYEGFHRFSDEYRDENAAYVPPVFSYPRKLGVTVTGGYVYRGKRSPSFHGVYIFGDFESRKIWGLTQVNRRLVKIREIGTAPQKIVSFAEDHEGELYVIGYSPLELDPKANGDLRQTVGTIYKLDLSEAVFE